MEPRLPNSLKMASKLTQNESQNQCFWDSFSMNYAILSDISSIRKSKCSNTTQIMPTSTKKTHSTQRGVGGMRRKPGKFSGSPTCLTTLPQAFLLFFRKVAPFCGSPTRLATLLQALFFLSTKITWTVLSQKGILAYQGGHDMARTR